MTRAIVGHFVGDILLQNRWLARVKRDKFWGLVLHCLIVTVSICAFAGWWDWRGWWAFFAHLLIDGLGLGKEIWPRLLRQGNPDDDAPVPMWLRLLDDQVLHVVSLVMIGVVLA